MKLHLSRLTLLALLALGGLGRLSAATLPSGFSEATVNGPAGAEWNEAVGTCFEDNGRMYVWERGGRVWFKEYGSNNWTLLIDISEEVGYWRDFGLLGFALDPNFRVNGNIYLCYVVDRHHLINFGTGSYNPNSDQYFAATIGRITRYTARAADGFSSVDYGTREVLLGQTRSNGFPILHESHGVGTLVFGTDGTLLASCGDGASYNSTDVGSAGETYYVQALANGIIRPKENVGAYRAQLVDCLSGKIIRIDPATGEGIPSNPFYDPLNPGSARSKVWALGLRNPFRLTLRPGTGSHNRADANPGVLYIGDVGWITWEDLNVCTGPGQNFGWPAFEGIDANSSYYNANVQNLDAPNPLYPGGGCSQYFYFRDLIRQATTVGASQPPFDNPCNGAQKIPGSIPQFLATPPALDWEHGTTLARTWIYNGSGVATAINVGSGGSPVSGSMFPGNCSIGGAWYNGSSFPAQYTNTYFHADFGEGWIRKFVFTTNDAPTSVASFLSNGGSIVDLEAHPFDGGLYYLTYVSETSTAARKISYSASGNLPPSAVASADTNYGAGPLTVQFTGNASTDPEGLPLSYDWNFGDGTPHSFVANPSHTFNAPAGVPTPYTVTLTVTDNAAQNSATTLLISVNNTPPAATISSPTNGTQYSMAGTTIYDLTAVVSDNEFSDGQLQYKWQTILHHNNHEHPNPVDTNHVSTTTISPVGCDGNTYYYRIKLTVTDPAGLSAQDEVNLYPDCTNQPPVAIVTSSLPGGAINVFYSATLTATGGTPPYDWGISSGSLPAGMSLDTNSGAISGTPTVSGPFNFTAQVSDQSNPVQSATKPLSLMVAAAPTTVGNTNEGALTDQIGAGAINAGRFQATANVTATSLFAKVVGLTGNYKCAIYADNSGEVGPLLRTTAEVSNPANGWQAFPLASPLVLTNGQFYWLAIWSDAAAGAVYYSSTAGTLQWGFYAYGAWPNPLVTTGDGNLDYCIYAAGAVPALSSISVTPAGPAILAGDTLPFTATGIYSDSSQENLTSQATWVSSNTVVASIDAGGLATGLSSGSATISATMGGVSGSTTLTVQAPPPPAILTFGLTNELVTITASAIPGRSYILEYVENLGDSNWIQLLPPVVAVGPTVTVTNATGNSATRFYRILNPAFPGP